jgi:hypothetical protein
MRRKRSTLGLLTPTLVIAAAIAIALLAGQGFGPQGGLLSLDGLALLVTVSFARQHGLQHEKVRAPVSAARGERS